MKKSLILATAIGMLWLQACKHRISQDQIPTDIRASLAKHVPHARQVEWEENPDYYFAYFTENEQQGMALFYRADGHWIETDEALKVNNLTIDQKKMLMSFRATHIDQIEEVKKSDSTDVIRVTASK